MGVLGLDVAPGRDWRAALNAVMNIPDSRK